MNFKKQEVKDFYLLTTEVENLFLNEAMPVMPGDFVKVYLYALMSMENQPGLTNERLARVLRISEDRVLEAWNYLAEHGLIHKIPNGEQGKFNFDVEFVSQRNLLYGNIDKDIYGAESSDNSQESDDDILLEGQELKEIINFVEETVGHMLSAKDLAEIASWSNELEATKDTIMEATKYCVERGKSNINYIAKVVLQWTDDGLKTKEQIAEHIKSLGERQSCYKRVVQSLGYNRSATDAEKKLIDVWLDEWHYNIERILDACDRTLSKANPNLRYVNKVLENWKEEAGELGRDVNNRITVTQAEMNKYLEHVREEAFKLSEKNRDTVYEKVPRIRDIDQEIKELGTRLSIGVLKGLSKEEINDIRNKINAHESERLSLMTDNGFPADFTDVKYVCEKCKDTGIDENGMRCSCLKERIGEAELWQQSQK